MAVKVEESDENKKQGAEVQGTEEIQLLRMQLEEMQKALDEVKSARTSKTSSIEPATDMNIKLFEEMMKRVRNAGEESTGVKAFQNYTSIDEITAEDMLDEPDQVTFMCPKVAHVVVDGYINNRPVPAPYKPIMFKLSNSKRVKSGKETDIFYVSKYTCKSKKELEFLRKHHLLGVVFFEDSKNITHEDVHILTKMASVLSSLNKVDAVSIVQRCKAAGIPVSDDVRQMRASLAGVEAKRMVKEEASRMSEHVRNAIIEQELLK